MPPEAAIDVVVDLNRVALPLARRELFARECPIELEIGVGKGRFLLERAVAHPEVGLLGVERARKYLLLAASRAARRGLGNVRLLQSTAEDVLFRCLASESVAVIHVYFPDPWPKKRHHKRRLFQPETVARMAEVLEPGGSLLVKTDHQAYAAVIGEVLGNEPLLEPAPPQEAFATIPPTSFEIKYQREQRPLYRFAYRRSGAAAGRFGAAAGDGAGSLHGEGDER